MTPDRLARLRALANDAEPGPYRLAPRFPLDGQAVWSATKLVASFPYRHDGVSPEPMALYLEALTPEVVIELCDTIGLLRRSCDVLVESIRRHQAKLDEALPHTCPDCGPNVAVEALDRCIYCEIVLSARPQDDGGDR